jgi:hypothetical protein
VSIDEQGGINGGALVPAVEPVASRPDPVGPWALGHDPLVELADELSLEYRAATPFPHVVLDDFFPDALLDELLSEFPPAGDDGWKLEDGRMQLKQQWRDANRLPPVAASFVALLQSAPFVSFLERLTGVAGLVGDPHCHHGGLHQTATGGFLKVHADQLVQPALGLQRRVNVIVFLNRGWLPEWGGDLELWDAAMTRCCQRIEPVFNRVVVFDAVGSNHGHPDPATSPPDVLRRSVALYYYVSPAHPSASSEAGVAKAVVRARPGEVLPQRRQPSSRWRRVTRKVHGR